MMKKQWLILLCTILCVFAFSGGLSAAELLDTGISGDAAEAKTVHVIIENTTFTEEVADEKGVDWKETFWSGTLIDTRVAIDENSTMMSCVKAALGSRSISINKDGYIDEINGLGASACGSFSGWMGMLNDWFTNAKLDSYTVAKGTLQANDEIRVVYSLEGGADLGGTWGNNDTSLKALVGSEGTLSPEFAKDVKAYTLALAKGTKSVVITPTAANKNFQVRTYVGEKEYRRHESIPVEDGTVIKVKCGDPSWPTMNNSAGATEYTITVAEIPFTDLQEDAWYWDSMCYVYLNGIMNGMSDTTFEPNSTLTRGMYITMLYRLDGEPEVKGTLSYDDVDADEWYADAVLWGTEKKIVEGYGDEFGPKDEITREQMAVMMYRYAKVNGADVSASASLDGFKDGSSVSSWAKDAMGWAVEAELIQGYENNTLKPTGNATRAEAATVVQRFAEMNV